MVSRQSDTQNAVFTFALENRENAAVKQSIEKPTIFCPIFCNHLSKIAAQCQAFLPEIKYWQ